MSITTHTELLGIQKVSEAVGITLKKMRDFAQPGMSTAELDEYGGSLLREMGARSAPKLTYGFPGWTCISLNEEVAHGIPSAKKVLKGGDLVNIDVSAELDGFWADNGGSFVVGNDVHQHAKLVEASQRILHKAIGRVRSGVRISEIGRMIESEAKKTGFRVIRNLAGHGVGRSLHEAPLEILNCYDSYNRERFRKNSVLAIETFIATHSTIAREEKDGWTLKGNRGGFVAQHEHTIMVTDQEAIILTEANEI
ncbi:methionyl aminopeptidase [Catalinimonas alkaloidigena]|uniref:type I methionyl aminopeptidase n=1 Tax=Catalinimonas alkaloidigena TaxID=1075417 RepID=UPI0024064A00|nr:type I methionyl aminopeptidase [Catalinimonas alkaloidigena]MDF9798154.1 methionyl aminopeptidase [Catalinimonas alkaloidigena]